jgi:putative transposase
MDGTTSLFAALDVAAGQVIGKCRRRHRSTEFVRFLQQIDDSVPSGLDVHLILDNLHKPPAAPLVLTASALPRSLHTDVQLVA